MVKALGSSVFSAFKKRDTYIWINLLIEIRFTIHFIISNFYQTLSYLCPGWILYAIFFIYYAFIGVLARCAIVHCFFTMYVGMYVTPGSSKSGLQRLICVNKISICISDEITWRWELIWKTVFNVAVKVIIIISFFMKFIYLSIDIFFYPSALTSIHPMAFLYLKLSTH